MGHLGALANCEMKNSTMAESQEGLINAQAREMMSASHDWTSGQRPKP